MTSHLDKEWLNEIYDTRRKRTIEITLKSIELLLIQQEKVSLSSIIKISHQFDIKGISQSAILNNPEAKKLYETHRSWSPPTVSLKKGRASLDRTNFYNLHVKVDRDFASFKKRYSKLTKTQLIERLAVVEEAYALLHKKWLEQQSVILESHSH